MKVFNRIIATTLSLMTALFSLEGFIAGAVERVETPFLQLKDQEVINDAIWESPEDYTARTGNVINELNLAEFGITNTTRSIPSSFDISTNSATKRFFPPVGNQNPIGSCVGWATTYYQFTYEVNRLRDITTGEDPNNIYSPSFTYNYINGGRDTGSNINDAYDSLHNHGAMNLADFPHNNTNYSLSWSTDEAKLVEALNYRATAASIQVESTSSPNFEAVKSMIANGHIAVISTNPSGRRWGKTSDNEWCVVRGSEDKAGGHAMAVVGYDDNLTITADGETLTGAFKLVNSSGPNWRNSGYTWVAYDALNATSVHEDGWNYSESRSTVFRGNNEFYFISVEECDVAFAGLVNFRSNDKWNLKIYGDKGSTAVTLKHGDYLSSTNHTTDNNCVLAFDFFEVGSNVNINNCLTSFWTFKTVGNSSYTTSNIKYRIVDNLNNRIGPNYNVNGSIGSSGYFSCPIYVTLAKGRVTSYDNLAITSDDSLAVLEYLVKTRTFSNLQKLLADYNSDGEVDILDVTAMNRAINGASYSLTDYIDEWGCSLADVIEAEYGLTVEEFIEENANELSEMGIAS